MLASGTEPSIPSWVPLAELRALRASLLADGLRGERDFVISYLQMFANGDEWILQVTPQEFLVSYQERATYSACYWSTDLAEAGAFLREEARWNAAEFSEGPYAGRERPNRYQTWTTQQISTVRGAENGIVLASFRDASAGVPGVGDWRWGPRVGEVEGSWVVRTVLASDVNVALDRIGDPHGEFLWRRDAPFETRSLPPDTLASPRHAYRLNPEHPWVRAGRLKIERSLAAPSFGQPGGALQHRFLDAAGRALVVDTLTALDILREEALT